MFLRLAFVSVLLAWCATPRALSAEPFLKPNDVIALVGGEDMVTAAEYGYLELLLQRALPDYRLKVRSLAWEGDTVFEQQRDLNYPTLEQQLDEIGATVVIMQFGQMESLAGTSKLPEFIKAYEKLIERLSAGGKRRVVVQVPGDSSTIRLWDSERKASVEAIRANHDSLSQYRVALFNLRDRLGPKVWEETTGVDIETTRDGIHYNATGLSDSAHNLATQLLGLKEVIQWSETNEREPALTAIRAKNRLWFNYYRPQNWAFLAGDRTEQPSSRDWKDPSKRWFPEEMKEYLPLIDQKEKEIWALAKKTAKP